MQYSASRIKIPPHLKVDLLTDKDLGDAPVARITNPKNLPQPSNVAKISNKQYVVYFASGSAGEVVDIVVSSVPVGFFRSMLVVFTLTFWSSFIHNKDSFRNFSLKTFIVRSLVVSGLLFVVLVGLVLSGVSINRPFARWLNTLDMAQGTADKIESLFSKPDPFFQSAEATRFYERTGHRLEKVYTMAAVVYEDVTEKMLIRKNFFPADHLDAAEDICAKEIGAEVPDMPDYKLWVANDGVRGELSLAFAEWTETSRGFVSDDYELFVSPENVATLQMSMAEIKGSSGDKLTELADNYDVKRNGKSDDDLKIELLEFLYKHVSSFLIIP